MNWTTAIMLFLAWQLLSKNSQSAPKIQDIAPFLNDDTKGILDGVTTLSSPTATSEDKTGAIFQMMTNPTVMSFAQNLFGNGTEGASQTPTQSGQQDGVTFETPPMPSQQEVPFAPQGQSQTAFTTADTTTCGNGQGGQFSTQVPQTTQNAPPSTSNDSTFATPPQNTQQPPSNNSTLTHQDGTIPSDFSNIPPPKNDEGYTFASPTERARQFFAPIDTITTAEIKHKLCYFYDNWYLKK